MIFFSFNSEFFFFFFKKKILGLTKMIHSVWRALQYFDRNNLHFFKCGNSFLPRFKEKFVVLRVNMILVSLKQNKLSDLSW